MTTTELVREAVMRPQTAAWEKWFKVVSWAFPLSVLPAITWAFQVERQLTTLSQQMVHMIQQYESERAANRVLAEKVDQLRQSVEALRTDLVQRMARVETKLEQK